MQVGGDTSLFMQRAFELARLGFGDVSPNPMVGCVIVHEGFIIGEGFHQQFGGPHAEVNAINAVDNKHLLPESTVYVTLEPCSFFGKTPPCADLLVKYKVKKVIVSTIDPNPKVSGKGIDKLKKAGVVVEQGLLEDEGAELNKRFFTSVMKKRPYIILKWAETSDGFIARKNYDSKWISNEYSRKLVHKWRSEEDAILVGKNTAKYDNPSLNARDWTGKDPLRIVIDHDLQLNKDLTLFDKTIHTICYNLNKDESFENLDFVKLNSKSFLQELLYDLHKKNIQSIIVEGGSKTLSDFINSGLWDEARVFQSDKCFGSGIPAPQLLDAEYDGKEDIAGDSLRYFRKKTDG